jgi:antitoxin (DNA-binding transcriptional repressor) of toxin-antitoxin stability system
MTTSQRAYQETEMISVAEAKRRFSELIDRVGRGETILVSKRGKPALALVRPDRVSESSPGRPLGLLSGLGALADWEDIDEFVKEIYASRRRARDREVPDLE